MAHQIAFLRMGLVAFAALLLVGCSGGTPSERSARSNAVTGLGTGSTSTSVSGLAEKCSNGSSAFGYVTSGSVSTGTFRDNVAGLISATMDPTQLGQIAQIQPDASTGIDMQLRLSLSNGQLSLANSAIQLTIYDSLVGTKNAANELVMPIVLGMAPAVSGQVNQTARTFTATFQDNYGSISVQGSWTDSTVQGTISYSNSANKAGGSPASGMLGGFLVPTCGVF